MAVKPAKAAAIFVGTVAVAFVWAVPPAWCGTWKLRWEDAFDGPAGSLPDSRYWTVETGAHGFGAGELQAYTDHPQNISINGRGELVISALRERFADVAYTSGRIHTRGKQEFKYGAVEVRAKFPCGYGIGPAIWTSGFDKGDPWPWVGERDIVEVIGAECAKIATTLIGASKLDRNVQTGGAEYYYFPEGQDATGWHVYRHEFAPAQADQSEEMRFYVDGNLYRRTQPEWFGGVWNFDKYDHFLLLNVAVGGDRPWGFPSPDTPFPQSLTVDYVRFYDFADK